MCAIVTRSRWDSAHSSVTRNWYGEIQRSAVLNVIDPFQGVQLLLGVGGIVLIAEEVPVLNFSDPFKAVQLILGVGGIVLIAVLLGTDTVLSLLLFVCCLTTHQPM